MLKLFKCNVFLIYLITFLLIFQELNVLCFQRSIDDEWFALRYKPEVIKPGDNKTFPKIGDDVKMLFVYIHTKTQKELRVSWNKNDPEHVTVGRGYVFKCMDDSLLRMSKGQKIRIFCSHKYALGAHEDSESGIHPNMDLFIEMKLLGIVEKKKDL